ncbi:MAG: adenylosuccinate synthetase [Elusimicrobiales bacterium]|nr:adenylosuccinate synthetase [Elusimicrobiales bacterium]
MVDIICGGQAGDEGKGKIAAYLAIKDKYDYCIKVGGPNAGHTVFVNGKPIALRSIPAGFVNPKTKLILPAGSYVIAEWLYEEIKETNTQDRLIIDPNCVVITERQKKEERENLHLMGNIGSVGTGLGIAIRDRIERKKILFAKDCPQLKKYIKSTYEILVKEIEKGKKILIEGTQGIKLSLLHGDYPYTTSRDTTASTFLSESGLGPKYVKDIYLIIKPYVSRVGPGPLKNEITNPKELEKYHTQGREIGSVSKRLRRIGKFEFETVKKAILINSATKIAVTHFDLIYKQKFKKLNEIKERNALKFIQILKKLTKIYPYPKLSLISIGPNTEDIIDLR